MEGDEDVQIKLARKYVKMKISRDDLALRGQREQRRHVVDLLTRTAEAGESNSALVIGPRGCGKTAMIRSALRELGEKPAFARNSTLVRLSGLLHADDRLSLKAITAQMRLDGVVGDRAFGSFSENLAFLLSSLRERGGRDERRKSVVFVLEEFDLFCHTHASQTLLYNLFDVAQSKQTPVCVLGVTCRLDVTELLEKRVKSRFSHRQIFLFPDRASEVGDDDEAPFRRRVELFANLLSLPVQVGKPLRGEGDDSQEDDYRDPREIPHCVLTECKCSWRDFRKLDPIFATFWNENVQSLAADARVSDCLRKMYDVDGSERSFRTFLTSLICKLKSDHPQLETSDVVDLCRSGSVDDRVSTLASLSVLEMTLIVAMKHQAEIFDDRPMNFEMVYARYAKFAGCDSSSRSVPRAVVLKAFEHLESSELIGKEPGLSARSLRKEYQMYRLLATPRQVAEAVGLYRALPTEVSRWACGSAL